MLDRFGNEIVSPLDTLEEGARAERDQHAATVEMVIGGDRPWRPFAGSTLEREVAAAGLPPVNNMERLELLMTPPGGASRDVSLEHLLRIRHRDAQERSRLPVIPETTIHQLAGSPAGDRGWKRYRGFVERFVLAFRSAWHSGIQPSDCHVHNGHRLSASDCSLLSSQNCGSLSSPNDHGNWAGENDVEDQERVVARSC